MTTAVSGRDWWVGLSDDQLRDTLKIPPNPIEIDAKKAQAAAACLTFLEVRPRNRLELQWYVDTFYGYRIPEVAVCPGHVSPLDALWDAFGDERDEFVWVGPRAGGKTIQFAILEHLSMFFNGDTVANGGAVEEQALKCYSYFSQFANLAYFRPYLLKPPMLSKTFFKSGASLEIFPMTMNRLNSPHTRRLMLDEIELTTDRLMEEAANIPLRLHGRAPSTIYTSSRKHAFGPMERLLERSEPESVRTWCVLEVAKTCPPTRHQNGVGCETCPLMKYCKFPEATAEGVKTYRDGPGRLAQANGWMEIDDIIARMNRVSAENFESQSLSLRPGRKGLVYPDFDPNVHVIDYDWKPSLPIGLGIDFGFVNPNVCVAVQALPNDDLVIFDEIYVRGTTAEQFAALIRSRPWYKVWKEGEHPLAVADPANAGDRATLKNHGVPNEPADKSQRKGESSIDNGIALVRWTLAPPGRGRPLLYVDRSCKQTIREFKEYHTPESTNPDERDPQEKPSKVSDHAMDGIRYLIVRLFQGQLEV